MIPFKLSLKSGPGCKQQEERMNIDEKQLLKEVERLEKYGIEAKGNWTEERLQIALDDMEDKLRPMRIVHTLMERMETIKRKLMQIKEEASLIKELQHDGSKEDSLSEEEQLEERVSTEERVGSEEQMKRLEGLKATLSNEIYNMHLDDFFIARYIGALDDCRVVSLPLPFGFMCHKAYEKELEYLKNSIEQTKNDVHARREMLHALYSHHEQDLKADTLFSEAELQSKQVCKAFYLYASDWTTFRDRSSWMMPAMI